MTSSATTTLTQKPEAPPQPAASCRLPAVCMVTSTYPPDAGGGGIQARTLALALARQQLARCFVVALTGSQDLPTSQEQEGVSIRRIFVDINSPASKASALWKLSAELLRLKSEIDVIHLHGFTQKNVLVSLLNQWLKKPLIQKLTSLGADDPASLPPTFSGKLQHWAYGQADKIIAVSPALKTAVESQETLRHKVVLIGNGVDCRRFIPVESESQKEALRSRLRLPEKAFIVLSVGFFSRQKDPLSLWRAWQKVFGDKTDCCLVFVGATQSPYFEIDPALAVSIRQEAEKAGCLDKVIFIEQVTAIEEYYRAADLFALPSQREGLPNALLEAMACGLPCVASRLPGLGEWLINDGINGLLIEPKDTEALAQALSRFFSDSAFAQHSAASARETILERFDIEQIARSYAQLYRQLAGQSP